MLCESCGAKIEEGFTFCPHCGHTIGEDDAHALERGRVAIFPTREQLFPHWIWLLGFGLFIGCILMSVLGVGMAGLYGGLKERAVLAHQEAEERYNRGLAHLEEGDYNLAEAEFREALRLAPDYWEAADKLREVRAQVAAMATPTSETRNEATDLIYQQAQELYSQQNWIETTLKLEQLRGLDPYYERENVTEMLFSSYYNMALDLVDKDRLEEALRSFDGALEVKPGDPEALVQRELTSLYLTGLDYWEADWVRAVESFLAIYQIEPEYKDVKQRLYEAYLNHGDLYASEEAWCLAEERYEQAVTLDSNEDIIAKRDDAAYRCQVAVAPTPAIAATATPTATIAAAATVTATVAPTVSVSTVGKIAFAAYDAEGGAYTIYVVQADGSGLTPVAVEASQPTFSPDGQTIVFHSWRRDRLGLQSVSAGGGEMTDIIFGTRIEDGVPSWSRDGERITFASNKEGDRQWRIYVSWLVGEGEPIELRLGEAPDWSPEGDQIVHRGCDERGDNCGIYIMNDNGANPTRLTTDASDNAPAWSPDGSQVAFMSARDGNWEIYVVDLANPKPRRLTTNRANDGLPTWSPDGQRIAFLSDRGGIWAIHLMNPDGSDQHQLVPTGGTYENWLSEQISWAR
ncbi:MAG: tetratricopeptide repeat protein [Anaerolineales bacterium]|nr:MAG: tetratricopeptide repeat protein [Anaerolineales bacterium]